MFYRFWLLPLEPASTVIAPCMDIGQTRRQLRQQQRNNDYTPWRFRIMATSERASFRETPGSQLHARGRWEVLLVIATFTLASLRLAPTAVSKPNARGGCPSRKRTTAVLPPAGRRALSAPLLRHPSSPVIRATCCSSTNEPRLHARYLWPPIHLCRLS